MTAIRESLSDLASSDNQEVRDDEADDEEDTGLHKLSKDDEPSWVMGTIDRRVQPRMEGFRQKQMSLDKFMQLGWRHVADYVGERDMYYGVAEIMVPLVVKPQTDTTAATPSPTTFGEIMQIVDIVPGQLQMPQETTCPASSEMRPGSEKPMSHQHKSSLPPDRVPDFSHDKKSNPAEPVSFYSYR